MCGAVVSVDDDRRMLSISREGDDALQTLRLDVYPLFPGKSEVLARKSVSAGQPICVYYVEPLIGRPYVTKVLRSSGTLPSQ